MAFPPANLSWTPPQPITQRDPLGLTPEQRAAGPSLEDELRATFAAFMIKLRENLAAWDAVPAGTMIHGCFCGQPHPVELFR